MSANKIKRVNCMSCKYYAVTWEPKFPNSCRFFGFKTTGPPSVTVFKTTGEVCEAYEKKKP
ncbi:MAG: uracil-DNA glycosylase [Oscillospiraceae bacterium]|nr:uracil-DNA glycosylase [Oscillospiraceae bacterium]